ncbi:CPBP family intramembrane metalloprotease [Aestuariimicrobium ganziense]|uniref:CPBP family intramembrane metalloprotease n=1 Tax=Aestuariimicrobium ganziense TaxID=2773677 RepID=UPI001944BED4|nr:CPBP family intramembrane metalloprotease [Aestuariimicrobium ganziense]
MTTQASPEPAAHPATTEAAQTRPKRRVVRWNPGLDTAIAAATLLLFSLCYYLGTREGTEWVLIVGIIVLGTIVPAWTVFMLLRGGWSDLGITRHRLKTSLAVAAFLGAGSAFQVFQLANEKGVDPWAHLVANVMVFWEPLFVFGWLFLRWEKAFGWLPAIGLVGVGFTLQHFGSVPFEQAVGFGIFGLMFAVVFAITRNLFILWPLFYGVASGIGTLQAGFVFDWSGAVEAGVLMLVQMAILVGIARWARARSSHP